MVQLKWLGRYGPIACILWYERLGQICHFVHCQHRKSRLVEMLPVDGFQSGQCIIIHHTHNESLEWSRCSGLAVTVPILTNFSMRIGNTTTTISSSSTGKVSWWRCLHQLDSNLNSASSFIILIMSHWSGPAAVVWPLCS